MNRDECLTDDLREVAEKHLGKPLVVSQQAGLWRCPACPPESYALLMVSAAGYRCLRNHPCDGGMTQWMYGSDTSINQALAVGESA